jgi:hypothetical protein
MLRKLNFTERVRLPRSAVQVDLHRESDGALAFDARFALEASHAPPEARLFLEAWFRTSYMRFDCGTVSRPQLPAERRLTEIDSDNCVRFRLKIVDHTEQRHRILAVADDLLVCLRKPDSGARTPLLPVNFTSLGDLVWRIDFDVSGAVLELNNRIDSIETIAKNDPQFFALVYPAAVREILTRILLVEEHEILEESEEWWSLWVRWASRYAALPSTAEAEDRQEWIQDVVSAFAAQHELVLRMSRKKDA